MSSLYSLIFERQFTLQDLSKGLRFLGARLRPSRPKSLGKGDHADFDESDFAKTRFVDRGELEHAPRNESQVEVTDDVLDTLPADLQDEFVKSVAKAQRASTPVPRTLPEP